MSDVQRLADAVAEVGTVQYMEDARNGATLRKAQERIAAEENDVAMGFIGAKLIINVAVKVNAETASFEFNDADIKGEPIGSWIVTATKKAERNA